MSSVNENICPVCYHGKDTSNSCSVINCPNKQRGAPTPDSEEEVPKQARLLTELTHEQLVARCLQLDYDKRQLYTIEQVLQILDNNELYLTRCVGEALTVEAYEKAIKRITEKGE